MLKKNKSIKKSLDVKNIYHLLNPFTIICHLWQYRSLIKQLTWREVVGRYKGSFIGLGWSIIQPLLMLCVYTFVFSVIFKSKWGVDADEGRAGFALTLFMGIITYNIFSEVVNIAPSLILCNVNYVKKVVFPLEILPVVALFTVLINVFFSLCIIIFAQLLINFFVPWTVILIPIVWMPIILFTLGIAYFLSSLSVFIRDIGATVSIITTMIFFMSPIFYPMSAVPEKFKVVCLFNPIAIFVEDARRVALWGMFPDWPLYCIGLVLSLIVFNLGFIWFIKSKKAFADVI